VLNFFVSLPTVITIVIGIAIAFVYLRYMWLALQRVARTLDDPDDGKSDGFGYSFVGAIIAVIASSLAIVAYGFAPQMLYIGVALALASPIAVAYTFRRELDD
jgi:cobalamin synthase